MKSFCLDAFNPKKQFLKIGIVLLFLILLSGGFYFLNQWPQWQENKRFDDRCEVLGVRYLETEFNDSEDFDTLRFYYSRTLDTCIMRAEDELGNNFILRDIKGNFLKDWPILFSCGEYGITNGIPGKITSLDGYVYSAPWEDWVDGGESIGFIPLPEGYSYTREDCRQALELKEREIR